MHADPPRFVGMVEHALDEKGRLIVPARFRERLGTGFILTIGSSDPCLLLYPEPTWQGICDALQSAATKDDRFRRFVRNVFAHTEEVACDGQGRLLIPPALRAHAGIERDVTSIGALARVEIWARDRFPEFAAPADASDIAAELGLY